MGKLTDTAVKAFKPESKPYKKADGGGLHLLITPQGGKLWRLSYRHGGKQKTLTGGSYPIVGLAAARRWQETNKGLLAQGLDPANERKREAREAKTAAANTFEITAREWHENRKPKWSERHAWILMNALERDIFPEIGHMSISTIEPADVLATVRKIQDRGAVETGKRMNSIIGEVFRYAIAEGTAKSDPSRDITAALKSPKPVQHHAKLSAVELPEFLGRWAREPLEETTRIALLLTIHTMVRTNEMRFATWQEFSGLEGKSPMWEISAERMKARRPHVVPLSPQAVALLKKLQSLELEGDYLFPGRRKGAMSENTMLFGLYRAGYRGKCSVHGFRSTASTILNESGLWHPDAIERQLAHDETNKVRAAYNSAQHLKERRKMLEWWSNYIEARAAEGMLL